MTITIVIWVTPKAAAKHEILFNKPSSGQLGSFSNSFQKCQVDEMTQHQNKLGLHSQITMNVLMLEPLTTNANLKSSQLPLNTTPMHKYCEEV
jgi:hypothetical protein